MAGKIVLASGNKGKLREFRQMLEPMGYEIHPQSEFSVTEAEEPFGTFVENALAKARHVSRQTGLPAMADDSGICVDALGGQPGVHSARYAGDPKSDDRNNQKLIADLAGVENRAANYYCVLVYVRSADDPQPIIADGRWSGIVIDEPKGENGFGYDPYFLVPEFGKTAAELSPEEKNACSHRGKALKALMEKLA
ncbi:MAG: RdgB/HAM1 family non-canonical purine NTP pyrophosphatase [Oxalobacter sp.]|nr:RdgB/HAM1 family non-canonical purine NTP pyrophosphatase [Oxalobacter sp.]